MSVYNLEDMEDAAFHHQRLLKHYPKQAKACRNMVIRYLERYDSVRLSAYLGYANPKNSFLDRVCMRTAIYDGQYLICDMLKEAALGNPVATAQIIDRYARMYLNLPYAIIEGDK